MVLDNEVVLISDIKKLDRTIKVKEYPQWVRDFVSDVYRLVRDRDDFGAYYLVEKVFKGMESRNGHRV